MLPQIVPYLVLMSTVLAGTIRSHTPRALQMPQEPQHPQQAHRYGSQMSSEPQTSEERSKQAAVATILKLYSNKSHDKKRVVYLAHFSYRAEDVERPSTIRAYLCNKFVGSIAVMTEPSTGPVHATLPLNEAIDACRRTGVTAEELRDDMSVSITTTRGKDIPLADVASMTMELEDLEETPASSPDRFPDIRNRHRTPANLKQHSPEESEN